MRSLIEFTPPKNFRIRPCLLLQTVIHSIFTMMILRGLMAANIFYSLLKTEKPENWYETGLRIGWAVEALQTCFLVADDIMDSSTTRRGVPCWYKCAGLSAVNDSLTIG